MQEQVLYDRYGILVTNTRVQFGNTIHLIKNITAIQRHTIKNGKTWPIIITVAGLLLLLVGIFDPSASAIIWGIGVTVVGILITVLRNNKYVVLLYNSAQTREIIPVCFKNKDDVGELMKAINQAVVSNMIKEGSKIEA